MQYFKVFVNPLFFLILRSKWPRTDGSWVVVCVLICRRFLGLKPKISSIQTTRTRSFDHVTYCLKCYLVLVVCVYSVFYALMLCILTRFRCVWKSVTIYLYILMHVKLPESFWAHWILFFSLPVFKQDKPKRFFEGITNLRFYYLLLFISFTLSCLMFVVLLYMWLCAS